MLRFLLVLLAVPGWCALASAPTPQAVESSEARQIELAGRVLDRDGNPVEGVYVQVEIRDGGAGARNRSVRSGAGGAFSFTTEGTGDFTLSVFKPALGRADLALGALARGTRRTDLVPTLGDGHVITGRVQWPDGSPADVIVTARASGERRSSPRRAFTSKDGSFQLQLLGPGPFDLQAKASAVENQGQRQRPRARDDARELWSAFAFDVTAGTSDLVLTLDSGERLVGVVRAQDGKPVGAFRLQLEPADARHETRSETIDDAQGAFEIAGLPAGTWRAHVQAPGFVDASESVEIPQATALTLSLRPTSQATGRVLAPDGTPVAGAEIRTSAGVGASSDASGAFRIEAGDRLGLRLLASRAGFAPSEWATVRFHTGQEQEEVELRLRPSESIQGLVHDLGGLAAGEAEIDARSPHGWWRTRSGPDGRFVLTDLPPGEVELHALLASGVRYERQVTIVAGTPSEVLFEPTGDERIRLSGRVRVGDGSVPWSGYAQRDRERDTYPIVKTDDGRYTLALPGAGAWEIHLACGRNQAANEFHWRLALELGAEPERTLDLEVPLAHLRGRVTDASGAPVADCHVFAYQQREGSTRVIASGVDTDAEGRYDLLLSPGTFNLSVGNGPDKLELEGLVIDSEDPAPRDFELAAVPR
jgi:hypothetical protein